MIWLSGLELYSRWVPLIDYEPSLFFYCLQSTANNDRFRVNTQNLCSYLIKNNGQPAETRIMKGEL